MNPSTSQAALRDANSAELACGESFVVEGEKTCKVTVDIPVITTLTLRLLKKHNLDESTSQSRLSRHHTAK